MHQEKEEAKGMLVVALVGVIAAILVNDFINQDCDGQDDPVDRCADSDDTYNVLGDGLAGTVIQFVVPIVAVAMLLKIMGYI